MFCCDDKREIIKPLFESFYDSMMFSYFDGIFGKGYCDNLENPKTAVICSGDFISVAGEISCGEEIKKLFNSNRWAVVVPDKAEWLDELNKFGYKLERVDRFHTCQPKDNFDLKKLEERFNRISQHTSLKLEEIDEAYYYKALEKDWSESFVSNFKDFADFKEHGFGFVATHNGEIVSGTSTFSYYKNGVEIEVSTDEQYRKKGLATICASRFLFECEKRGLTPHWDARNLTSLSIAEKMGFVFRDKYTAFEFVQSQF